MMDLYFESAGMILTLITLGKTLEARAKGKTSDIILISNELGYGVVPIDKFDREYRETTGRVCTRLAKKSKSVVRIICGMECVLKDE